MRIEIFHKKNPDFSLYATTTVASKSDYNKVAEINLSFPDDIYSILEFAFKHTNHIEHSWDGSDKQENVKPMPGRHRSTSVGDIIALDGKAYEVAGCGWNEVSKFE